MRAEAVRARAAAVALSLVLSACAVVLAASAEDGAFDGGEVQAEGSAQSAPTVAIEVPVYRDKLRGSLYGQAFGLAWGFTGGIEFRYRRRFVPDDDFPDWEREVDINAALRAPAGDDFYCELSGLRAMRDFGPSVTWSQMAPYYRDTSYPLWHSDARMRSNLRAGIPAPDCGHYSNQIDHGPHGHADDLDAQMQVDFCGATNPGNPNAAIAQAWKFGHMMGHGDGAIGASVIAAMNAEAYVASSVGDIVRAGVAAAPEGSEYRRLLDDVVEWSAQWPEDWKRVWAALDEKWGADDRCPSGHGLGRKGDLAFNIDAKLHGGFILLGLLYGGGDYVKSLSITIRCGQDTDTSTQNLGSILGAYLGERALPRRVTSASGLSPDALVEGTDLTFEGVAALIEELSRASLALCGGAARGTGDDEVWTVARNPIVPPILEQWPEVENAAPTLDARVVSVDGRSVRFAAEATDDDTIAGYQWHFGDLTHADGADQTHVYSAAGQYEAVCYVTDGTGNTARTIVPVSLE